MNAFPHPIPDFIREAETLGVTGTADKRWALVAHRTVCAVMSELHPAKLITGGAEIVDSYALMEAHNSYHHVIVPGKPGFYNQETVLEYANFVQMAKGGRNVSESMMNRNQAMVDEHPDAFVAFPKGSAYYRRSGTWATVRRAFLASIPVWVVPLAGSIPYVLEELPGVTR